MWATRRRPGHNPRRRTRGAAARRTTAAQRPCTRDKHILSTMSRRHPAHFDLSAVGIVRLVSRLGLNAPVCYSLEQSVASIPRFLSKMPIYDVTSNMCEDLPRTRWIGGRRAVGRTRPTGSTPGIPQGSAFRHRSTDTVYLKKQGVGFKRERYLEALPRYGRADIARVLNVISCYAFQETSVQNTRRG